MPPWSERPPQQSCIPHTLLAQACIAESDFYPQLSSIAHSVYVVYLYGVLGEVFSLLFDTRRARTCFNAMHTVAQVVLCEIQIRRVD